MLKIRFKFIAAAILMALSCSLLQAQNPSREQCIFAKYRFDKVWATSTTTEPLLASTRNEISKAWGTPKSETPSQNYAGGTVLTYVYDLCSAEFILNKDGRVAVKTFKITAVAPPSLSPERAAHLRAAEASYEKSIADLQQKIVSMQAELATTQGLLKDVQSQLHDGSDISTLTTPSSLLSSSSASSSSAAATTAVAPSRRCAENGSCDGDISEETGKPKTVEVKGYYRKDGTYVKGHSRSK